MSRNKHWLIPVLVLIATFVLILLHWPKWAQPYSITGIAKHGTFSMTMLDKDSIGSVYVCMDRVHALGGGHCEIPKGSLRSGRTMQLLRRYEDVYVSVR